jgi:hypothetical protein
LGPARLGAGRKVIHHEDVTLPLLVQLPNQMAADKAGAAGDNNQGHLLRERRVRFKSSQRGAELDTGGAEEAALDEHAEDVLEGEVRLLDVHGDGGGDDDGVVAERSHLAAVVAGEADGGDALGASSFQARALTFARDRELLKVRSNILHNDLERYVSSSEGEFAIASCHLPAGRPHFSRPSQLVAAHSG